MFYCLVLHSPPVFPGAFMPFFFYQGEYGMGEKLGRKKGMEIEEVGTGAMAQCVKCLLHKHEDLNLDPSIYIKIECSSVRLQPQKGRQIPGTP